MDAHWGYRDGEIPTYAECDDGCGMILRTDRLDLLLEHEVVCPGETQEERDLAFARLAFEEMAHAS